MTEHRTIADHFCDPFSGKQTFSHQRVNSCLTYPLLFLLTRTDWRGATIYSVPSGHKYCFYTWYWLSHTTKPRGYVHNWTAPVLSNRNVSKNNVDVPLKWKPHRSHAMEYLVYHHEYQDLQLVDKSICEKYFNYFSKAFVIMYPVMEKCPGMVTQLHIFCRIVEFH